MADEFTVVIKSGSSEVSARRTLSIKGYVEMGIEKNCFDAETLELLAAMLTYGEAAKNEYANEVENAGDTEIETVESEIPESCDTTLDLDDDVVIGFNFYSANLANAAYAYVSYTDINGEKTKLVADIIVLNDGENARYVVAFDTFTAENASQIFTCELVDADGNVLASAQDSVVDYCARAIANGEKVALYEAFVNYIIAVSNYKK